MDYSAQAIKDAQQANTPNQNQQPVTPAAPVTPVDPAAAAPKDDQITLDDLFPKETPVTPAQPVAPVVPAAAAPKEGDDAAKAQAALNEKLEATEAKLTQTVDTTVQQINAKIERNNELTNFFSNPDNEPFRKYQTEIVKVATDPRFVGLKMDRAIAMALGTKTAMKLGAEIAQNATTRANGNRTGGGQNLQRAMQAGSGPDYSKMSNAEFEARTQAVMRGERPN